MFDYFLVLSGADVLQHPIHLSPMAAHPVLLPATLALPRRSLPAIDLLQGAVAQSASLGIKLQGNAELCHLSKLLFEPGSLDEDTVDSGGPA